jgi:hypothetical protein
MKKSRRAGWVFELVGERKETSETKMERGAGGLDL